jgi:hypothetical protein
VDEYVHDHFRSGNNLRRANETYCSHGPRKLLNGVLSDFHIVLIPPGRSKAIAECSGKLGVRLEPRIIPAGRVFPLLSVTAVKRAEPIRQACAKSYATSAS